MPDNGQVERMNRTIKEATVRAFHYAPASETVARPQRTRTTVHDTAGICGPAEPT
jgi:hypothetical protein